MEPELWTHADGEIALQIWQQLGARDLFRSRRVSPVWRDGITTLPRWRPIVPSPSLHPVDGETATDPMQAFAQWCQWCQARSEILLEIERLKEEMSGLPPDFGSRRNGLRLAAREALLAAQSSPYDAWAALAPYTRASPDEDVSWLRGALRLKDQPTTQRRGRSAGREPELARYFQTRERDADEEFRTWRSTPVHEFLREEVDAYYATDEIDGDDAVDAAVFSPASVRRPAAVLIFLN